MSNFEVVESAGFVEMKDLLPSPWWVNRSSRMAFNFEAVEDADEAWFEHEVRRSAKRGYFSFYFGPGTTMDGRICAEIITRMRMPEPYVDMRSVKVPQRVVHVIV